MAPAKKTPNAKRGWTPFLSWRWQIVLPLFVLLLLIGMVGSYWLTTRLAGGVSISQDNVLIESLRGVISQSNEFYERQTQEALRIAYTLGVAEAVQQDEARVLQQSIEALARASDLDSVILTNSDGVEVLGIQRVLIDDIDDYAVNSSTVMSGEILVQAALNGIRGESALVQTPEGWLLFVSVPLLQDDAVIGTVLVGRQFTDVLADLHASNVTEVVAYQTDGQLLESTFTLDDAVLADLRVPRNALDQSLDLTYRDVTVQSLQIATVPYRVAYYPFVYGGNLLGVFAVLLPDSVPFATEMGRQLTGLMVSGLVGSTLIVVFFGVSRMTGRLERLRSTTDKLAEGDYSQRTGMRPADEVGAVGASVDRFAQRVQHEQDALHVALRRQRRELSHLMAVLESLPGGVVIQDMTGRVLLMSQPARDLLGDVDTNGLFGTGDVKQPLGSPIVPGVYALGNPDRITVGEKVIEALVGLIVTANNERIGTVAVLHDITDAVQKEQQRARLLEQVESQAQMPPLPYAESGSPLAAFVRQITGRAVTLQKLIVEMRELTDLELHSLEHTQKPLDAETLVWTVANEWRQIAQAAGLQLHVAVEKHGVVILGDEKRLRWAMGNIIDNAVKYTPSGGAVSLEINKVADGQVHFRVRDNGTGIKPDELPNVFTPFYRGNPTLSDGKIMRIPGLGQGLHTAKLIIDNHGGYIKVKSRAGVGTAVYFSLPVTAATPLHMPKQTVAVGYEGETVPLPVDVLPNFER